MQQFAIKVYFLLWFLIHVYKITYKRPLLAAYTKLSVHLYVIMLLIFVFLFFSISGKLKTPFSIVNTVVCWNYILCCMHVVIVIIFISMFFCADVNKKMKWISMNLFSEWPEPMTLIFVLDSWLIQVHVIYIVSTSCVHTDCCSSIYILWVKGRWPISWLNEMNEKRFLW